MQFDLPGIIGPAVLCIVAILRACAGRQRIGSIVVACLMGGAIVLSLVGFRQSALVLSLLGTGVAVALTIYLRRWQHERRSASR